jgi:hypothetical protein
MVRPLNFRQLSQSIGHLALLVASLVADCNAGEIEKLDPPVRGFYSKRTVSHGVPILAHATVSDAALEEAVKKLDRLLGHAPEIVANLNAIGVELHVIGKDQAVTDLPEYRHMKGKPFDGKLTMDQRGRGYGGRECSCGEENLLALPSDRYRDHRDICSHEFAHGIFGFGLSAEIRGLVEACYHKAMAAGRWKGMYASTNADEYFAELTMWYVGSRGDYGKLDPRPKPGPEWLQSYDPDAYQLLDAIYTGRMKPEKIAVNDLKPRPASDEGKLKSANGPMAPIIFINHTDKPVHVFWLDFTGARKDHGIVTANSTRTHSTYATHVWLLEKESGGAIGIYVAERGVNRITIGDVP